MRTASVHLSTKLYHTYASEIRGGKKLYQRTDDIRKITMENITYIHKKCPEYQRCSDLKGEWFDVNENLNFKNIFWKIIEKKYNNSSHWLVQNIKNINLEPNQNENFGPSHRNIFLLLKFYVVFSKIKWNILNGIFPNEMFLNENKNSFRFLN